MTITYAQLDHLNLTSLNQAITAWEEVVRKMREVDESHDPKAQKPFEAAGWTTTGGAVDIAGLATTQLKAAGRESGDALTQARALKKVLTDARDDLKKQQKKLHDYIAETTAGGKVRVSNQGKVSFTDSVVDDTALQGQPGYGQAVAAEERRIDEIEGEIRKILKEATEIDDSAAAALRYNVGKAKNSFNEHATGDTEKAEERYDSARAAQLAHKGADMSNSELKEFNGLLKEHKKDPEFAERFATRMGGRGTLEFWEGMGLHGEPAPEGARKELLQQTRSQLGETLGTATQSDSKAMQDWKNDVIDAGGSWLGHDVKDPKGFQVMSDLMNSGRYDSAFLQDYGEALIKYETEVATRGHGDLSDAYVGKVLPGDGIDGDIDIMNKWGTDPMTGYMNALSNNHEASTEFFKDEKNFDYLTGGEGVKGGREWPEDAQPQFKNGMTRGYDALGHALESATTGSDYGDPKPELHRGKDERDVMTSVMERYGDPELNLMDKKNQLGISDSMGRIGAAYIDDLNYSMSELRGNNSEARGMEGLLGAKDENKFDPLLAKQFIREAGNEEDSHRVMSQAQQAFTTSRIHAHEGSEEAYRAAEWGLKMHGALDEARAEGIGAHHAAGTKAHQQAMYDSLAWQTSGVAVVAGSATSILVPGAAPVLVPVAADAASSLTQTALVNEIRESLVADAKDDTGKSIKSIDDFDYEAERRARTGIENYMDNQGVQGSERDNRLTEMNDAYDRGRGLTDTDNSR